MKTRNTIVLMNKSFSIFNRRAWLALAVLALGFANWRGSANEPTASSAVVSAPTAMRIMTGRGTPGLSAATSMQTETVLYTQDFEGAHGWTLNTSTGVNGADPNSWVVSDDEGGVAPGGCAVGKNGNKTLHVTSVFNPNGGASYDAGGLCGILFCPETNRRAESPAFSTVGQNNLKLRFNYIANGQSLIDNASVLYNAGAGWQVLSASLKSPLCGIGLGQWAAFEADLPAAAANVANLQIGINWTNNDDGIGTDPSVAIDNVQVVALPSPPMTGCAPASFSNRTTAEGLGNDTVRGVFIGGATVYAATQGGLSISTDGGMSFSNKTTANGLGNNQVNGVFTSGNEVFAATVAGLSISTDGGASFTNSTTSNGLGNDTVRGVFTSGGTLYAATQGGLSISTDGGMSFSNKTTANGLGNNFVNGVFASGSAVYAATTGGLSISTDGGMSFSNKTTANGLGNDVVLDVIASGGTLYAATQSGLSISTDGGMSFSNKTTANGLGNNLVNGVFASGSAVYAATTGGLSISTDGGISFSNKTTANGLGNNFVFGVFASSSAIYAATQNGLAIGSCNTAPTIAAMEQTVTAGSLPVQNLQVATVSDIDQTAGSLTVTITSANPANGVTLSNLTNTGGNIFADVLAECGATNASFTLTVTDSASATTNATLNVTVNPNPPPTLSYSNQTVVASTTPTFPPAAGPADNGAVASIVLQSITPVSGLTLTVDNSTGQVTVNSASMMGSYTVVIRATDNCAPSAFTDATFTINVTCPAISLDPASLPNAPVNQTYNQTLLAAPAGTTYSFSLTSGMLPNGLSLNGDGSFSGAPTVSGTFNFRVTATGWGGCPAFRDYTLLVTCPTITIGPASLPSGVVGASYSQTISATPAGAYSYAVTSGALPTGLTLNASTGAITGIPTTNGSFSFAINASAGACSGAQNYTMTIGCPSISFAMASPLPAGNAGAAYSQTLSVTPTGSYSFSLTAGSLPNGLTLNPITGVISGTPTTTGTATFTVKAQAATGCSTTQNYALTISCPSITVSPASLPGGTVGTVYSQTLVASPAVGSYTYTVIGTLPPGLNLNPSTGVLSGTPTSAGSFNFTLTATGIGGCTGSLAYTIAIGGGGCGSIALPATMPGGTVGKLYNSAVAASPAGLYSYSVTGNLPPSVTLLANGLLFGYPTAAGNYTFTITATQGACMVNKQYTVTIAN